MARETSLFSGGLLLLALCLVPQAQAQVTYNFGAANELLDAAFYAGQPADGSDVAGRLAFMGRSSADGKRVAFWGVNAATFQAAFFVVDLGDPSSWRRITADMSYAPDAPIYWTPDDSALFVGGFRIPIPAPGTLSTPVQVVNHGIEADDLSTTYLASDNWAFSRLGPQIAALPIRGDGTEDPLRQPVQVTDFTDPTIDADWPAVSPDGTLLGFADYDGVGEVGVGPDLSDVYVLKNIPALLAATPKPNTNISSLAPSDLANANIVAIRSSESGNFAHTPFFSQDKSLVLFSEDWNNIFADGDFFATLLQGDFDIMVSNSDGSGVDFRLQETGNQALPCSTLGGVRIVFVRDVGGVLRLFMSSIETVTAVSGTALPDNDLETTAPQEARDGSGTVVTVPASTTINFPLGEPQEIQIETPVDPVEEPQLPPGIDAIPVLRDFGPDGTTFTPAITVTISYTDAEIEGLDEALLRVYRYNPASGIYDDEITTGIVRDLANNRVSFSVDHFSAFGLGAPGDADGDGLPDLTDPDDDNDGVIDAEDPMPLDTDNDGFDNDNDADDDSDGVSDLDDDFPLDTDNDATPNATDPDDDGDDLIDVDELTVYGTDPLTADSDGDGFGDGDEVQAGTDPNDPVDIPELPLDPVSSGVVLALILAALGVRRAASVRKGPAKE